MQHRTLLYTVYFIYFVCGLALCFEGVFLPEFKEHFILTYTEQMYTMFAKNIPFILFSVVIGLYAKKIGFKNCLTIALFLFAIGTWLIVPGLNSSNYSVVLGAFFLIGTGFNFELVAGNPMLAALGDAKGSASRLNIGNALGAIAQIIAPLFIVLFIPETVTAVDDKLPYIKNIFIITAAVLAAAAIVTIFIKDTAGKAMEQQQKSNTNNTKPVWQEPKVLLGFIAIFLVVGAEAGLFGLYRNYVEDANTGALSSHQSQQMFTVYFAVFALGRLAGSYLQKKIQPAITLAGSLIIALLLMLLITFSKGMLAVIAITAIGFFVSIFFPTLYAIAIEGLGERTGEASGLLTMGFLGSALLPVLQGKIADNTTLQFSFVIAIVPYLFALYYVLREIKIQKLVKQMNV